MCVGRSSILGYGPLIETNYLYAPTPNGQSPSASLNKCNTPVDVFEHAQNDGSCMVLLALLTT